MVHYGAINNIVFALPKYGPKKCQQKVNLFIYKWIQTTYLILFVKLNGSRIFETGTTNKQKVAAEMFLYRVSNRLTCFNK